MSYKQTTKQPMVVCASGKRSRGRPRTCWWNCAEDLAWSCLAIPLAELLIVVKDQDVCRPQLELWPPQPQGQVAKGTNSVFSFKNDNDKICNEKFFLTLSVSFLSDMGPNGF